VLKAGRGVWRPQPGSPCTPRETDLLRHVVAGAATVDAIAARMGVTDGTVKVLTRRITARLDLPAGTRLAEVVAVAILSGTVGPPAPDATTAPDLTWREWQMVQHIGAGIPDAQIAARLGIAPTTIKTHLRGLYTKLGLQGTDRHRLHALLVAYRCGLLAVRTGYVRAETTAERQEADRG
jgi:DNA-binding NarL/FixJ family response regulator